MSSDSDIRRNPVNSGLVKVLARGPTFWYLFGRPRAASAHERSVVKLAPSAALRSTWWNGEIVLYGVWWALEPAQQ